MLPDGFSNVQKWKRFLRETGISACVFTPGSTACRRRATHVASRERNKLGIRRRLMILGPLCERNDYGRGEEPVDGCRAGNRECGMRDFKRALCEPKITRKTLEAVCVY